MLANLHLLKSIKLFSRPNKHYSPVNVKLTNDIRGASTRYNQELIRKKEELDAKEKLYEVQKGSTTRKKLKKDNSAAAEKSHLEHQKILELAYSSKRKLPDTVKKKKHQDELIDNDDEILVQKSVKKKKHQDELLDDDDDEILVQKSVKKKKHQDEAVTEKREAKADGKGKRQKKGKNLQKQCTLDVFLKH